MARYAIAKKELLKDKVVMELGCGCGVPGLAVGKNLVWFNWLILINFLLFCFILILLARYCEAKRVYLTDIHQPTIDNLQFNLELNNMSTSSSSDLSISESLSPTEPSVIGQLVNWCDPSTYPPEPVDVLIGSDLVYDVNILKILVPAVSVMLCEGWVIIFVIIIYYFGIIINL